MSQDAAAISELARSDFDEFLAVEVEFAKKMLKERGEFFPFGAYMKTDGEMVLTGVHPGDENLHIGQAHVDTLIGVFRQQAKDLSIRSCCHCADVRFQLPDSSQKSDAIMIGLEHTSGQAIKVVIPYRKGLLGRISYQPPIYMNSNCAVFGFEQS